MNEICGVDFDSFMSAGRKYDKLRHRVWACLKSFLIWNVNCEKIFLNTLRVGTGKDEVKMKIKIIKKLDEYSCEYNVGDTFEVTGTWYGGVHINGKTGIPVSLDKEEYEELKDMSPEEYQVAADYWIQKDKESKKMDPEQLRKKAEEFLKAHNTCALATGVEGCVRCTPLEYSWHDGAFWIFSEGGRKFVGLEKNKEVSLAVFEPYGGFGTLKSMQVQGKAQIVELFSEEYVAAAEFRKIPIEALKKLSHPMHLLKIVPEEMELLDSDFKKEGYGSRQKLS